MSSCLWLYGILIPALKRAVCSITSSKQLSHGRLFTAKPDWTVNTDSRHMLLEFPQRFESRSRAKHPFYSSSALAEGAAPSPLRFEPSTELSWAGCEPNAIAECFVNITAITMGLTSWSLPSTNFTKGGGTPSTSVKCVKRCRALVDYWDPCLAGTRMGASALRLRM